MKIATLLLMAALGTASVAALGADTISAEDFVKKAGEGGAAEVAMGHLVTQKATDPGVKAFGQRMVTDHTKANKELMTIATSKGLDVPTEPGLMEKGMKEKFEHKSPGAEFDHDYMKAMVKDHETDVKLFQTAANDTTLDPDLRKFAQKTLPTLESHLSAARTLEAKLAKKT